MLISSNSTNGTLPSLEYQNVPIGTVLAIGGNLLISVALNIQKFVHVREGEDATAWRYMSRPLWWLGVSLMALGELGNFVAYGFAPASMVAPLGSTTVIVNMVIAVMCLHEKLRPEDMFGSALAIVGAFLVVLFSNQNQPILSGAELMVQIKKPVFISYLVLEIVFLIGLFILLVVYKKKAVIVILLIVAIFGSFTVISAKAVSGMIQLGLAGRPQWSHPLLYVMIVILLVSAVVQIIYLNLAMRSSFSSVVVPTMFVFFTISAIIGGIVLYDEFGKLDHLEVFMFLLGCLLSFTGVYFIQMNREPGSESESQPFAKDDPTPDVNGKGSLTNLFGEKGEGETARVASQVSQQ